MKRLYKKADGEQLTELKSDAEQLKMDLDSINGTLDDLLNNKLNNELLISNGSLIGLNVDDLKTQAGNFKTYLEGIISSLEQIQ